MSDDYSRVNEPSRYAMESQARLLQGNNPERVRANWIRAEQRRRAHTDRLITSEEWADILEAYGHRCAYCDDAGSLTQDHVIPLSRGGAHHPDNLVPACLPCNVSKSDQLLAEWYGFTDRRQKRRVCA